MIFNQLFQWFLNSPVNAGLGLFPIPVNTGTHLQAEVLRTV